MNKQVIFERLSNLDLDKNKYIIISGASLVAQGVIETTPDIDLACPKEYYDSLNWSTKIGAFGKEIKYKSDFEISENLFMPNDTIVINGYRFLTIEKCLEIKLALNREKDKKVIAKLKKFLNK